MTISGGGMSPLLQLYPKLIFAVLGKRRRSFATLRTTINGGGMIPLLQLHPNDFMNLGESWKGGVALVPILGDPSQRHFGMTSNKGGHNPPLKHSIKSFCQKS